MKVEYLNIPDLADKRNIIVDGRRIVNTAAPASGVIYVLNRGRPRNDIEIKQTEELLKEAPL